MNQPARLLLLALLAIAPLSRAADAPAQRPWLLHLNGIGGDRACDRSLLRGLKAGGFDADMRIYDWTRGIDALEALQAHERNRTREAKAIAGMIEKQFRAEPDRPIILTCHSGGAGLAAWALEALPADVKVETWVLFAPALSPDYDLSAALRHVRGRAHVFSSTLDGLMLSAGTKMYGTIDGKKVAAAGLDGFVKPAGADDQQYAKLVEHTYQATWFIRYGNVGAHISPLMERFAREFVAVLLRTGDPPAGHDSLPAPQPPPMPQPPAMPAPRMP